jgi:hypothetical protein
MAVGALHECDDEGGLRTCLRSKALVSCHFRQGMYQDEAI